MPAALDSARAEPSRYAPLGMLLALALLHGLLYLAIVPPWQHYDEPTHFEYARLVALLDRRPGLNETDVATNRQIADSMFGFRFWPPGFHPDLFGPAPPNIGFSEKVHPSLYYAVAAVPLRWTRALSVEAQLYAARLVAVGLYLLVIATSWRMATVLAPDRPLLQLAAPLILILVPAFADQMSAVNNDALVNFSMAALLLGCVLLIRDGARPAPLALAALGLLAGILAKRTALVGLAPFAMALFWSLRRRPLRWRIWLIGLAALGLALGPAISTLGPAGWSIRPWVVSVNRQYLRLPLDQIGGSLEEAIHGLQSYPLLFDVLLTSFWARFGWGAVGLGWGADWALRAVALAGCIGLLIRGAAPRGVRAVWRRRSIWLFVVTILLAWLAVIVRFEAQPGNYIPRGRYLHLVIVPTIWLLALGFERLAPRRWRDYSLLGLALFFALLDALAWAVVLSNVFYRS
jgi:hypothetical protein